MHFVFFFFVKARADKNFEVKIWEQGLLNFLLWSFDLGGAVAQDLQAMWDTVRGLLDEIEVAANYF